MDVKLVSVQTDDGVHLDGAWRRPERPGSSRLGVDVVIFHHGTGGKFYNPAFVDQIAAAFLDSGCAVLRVNNRGHDLVYSAPNGWLGAAYETVDDCRHDWRAWIDFCRELGFERIALWGHSLGALKTIYYLANERDPRVVCAIGSSPPRFSYSSYASMDEGPKFLEYYERARQLVDAGDADSLISVTLPITQILAARTFVDKYGPNARYDILEHLPQVSAPILVSVGGLEDWMTFRGLPAKLQELAATTSNLTFELIPGADHQYASRVDALRDVAFGWLKSIGTLTAGRPA